MINANSYELSPEKIYAEFRPKVFGYVRSRVSHESDAEDITQDIFIKVFNKLDGFNPQKASLSTWIYTIAHNSVIDFYRMGKGSTSELSETLAAKDKDGLQFTLDNEELEQLAQALEKLTERERDIIIMRFYDERELQDIAMLMNLSYGNIRVIISRALKKLHDIMERQYPVVE